ncbi:hypothetical protein GCM10023189_35300 [Nibrella saemangeumensis]|uniref:Membrane protein involved in the export of O-antigen and teichoic acid n=1 Tax=Nibrella saemangeumensis TaxID=1084526 RepID=A0ABP8N5P7_9BACT
MKKDTLFYSLAKFLPSGVNFVCLSVFSYLLEPAVLGEYNVLFAGVMLSNALLFQWIRVVLLRYFNRYTDARREQFIKTIMFLTVAVLLLSLVMMVGFLITNPAVNTKIYVYGFGCLAVFSVYDINLELHRSSLASNVYAKTEAFRAVLFFVLSILLVYTFRTSDAICIAYILSMLLPLVVFRSNYLIASTAYTDKENLLNLLKFGLPLAVMLASSYVNNVIDRILIAQYLSVEKASLYSTSYDLFKQVIWIPFLIINLANYPKLIKSYEQNAAGELQNRLQQNINVLTLTSIVLAFFLIINARELVTIVLGEAYRKTALDIMPYIIIGTIFYGITVYHYNNAFQFKEKTKNLALIYLVGSAINILVNVVLLEKFQLMGAAYATLVSYLVIYLLSFFLGRTHMKIPQPDYRRLGALIGLLSIVYLGLSFVPVPNLILSILVRNSVAVIVLLAFELRYNLLGFRSTVTAIFPRLNLVIKT